MNFGKIIVNFQKFSMKLKLTYDNSSRSPQPPFTKLAKSHISAQFFVRVFVLGWYTYFETAQVLLSLCFREKGVKTLLYMNDIYEVL